MHYYLYKLQFKNGVHFGAENLGTSLEKVSKNCHCDTLYSAISHEILKLYGQETLQKFYTETVNGEFIFSDLLPYKNNDYLIPKPIIYTKTISDKKTSNSTVKKEMKKLDFIPITKLEDFLNGNIEKLDFAENILYEKNSISRDGDSKNNGLYSVGVTYFYENCGLYFIIKMSEDKKDWFDVIMKSLGLSGIGGKRTSGYGQFEVIDDFELDENSGDYNESLLAKYINANGDYYLTLSTINPRPDEIDKIQDGYYTLIKRQGFVQSENYADKILKKVPTVMINSGSCFKEKLSGEIIDVKRQGSHPVWRYGKPIMIGINL